MSDIKNIYNIKDDVTEITITGSVYNCTFIIDTDDISLVKKYTWRCDNTGYIQACNLPRSQQLYLHKYLIQPNHSILSNNKGAGKLIVDHIDRNKLNNRRCNLQEVTYVTNNSNQSKRSDNKTGVTGVKKRGEDKYEAQITHNGKRETKRFHGPNAFNEACEWRKMKAEEYNNTNGQ